MVKVKYYNSCFFYQLLNETLGITAKIMHSIRKMS